MLKVPEQVSPFGAWAISIPRQLRSVCVQVIPGGSSQKHETFSPARTVRVPQVAAFSAEL